jgi:hypothetical protein
LVHSALILTLAARHKLPAVHPRRSLVLAGGLISYGYDAPDQVRLAAGYVDRILRGAKPADLPVQAPTKFDTVVNLETAKALGLTIIGAGLTVTLTGYRLVFGRGRPLWSPRFNLPTSTAIDAPLTSGAVIFGVGWGLTAASSPTIPIRSISSGAPPAMSTAFSKARGPPTCRCNTRRSTSW